MFEGSLGDYTYGKFHKSGKERLRNRVKVLADKLGSGE